MTPNRRKYLSAAVLIISLLGLAYYAARNWADFQQLAIVNPWYVATLFPLLILEYPVAGLIIRELTLALDLKLSIFEAFGIAVMTGFHNMILPLRGGVASRAFYLKARHQYSYTKFLSTLSASYILMFLVASFLGLISLALSYAARGLLSQILFLAFLAIFVLTLLVVLFSPTLPETGSEWINRGVRVINGWGVIADRKDLIVSTTLLTLVQTLLDSGITFFAFRVFGATVPVEICVFLTVVGTLGQLIPLTPAGLGINEAIVLFSAQAVAVQPAQTLGVVLLGRAVNFIFLGAAGPLAAHLLFRSIGPTPASE